jgi:hypothetical protein
MSFLVKCFVCGGQVSRSASKCPHCGDPYFKATDKTDYEYIKMLHEVGALYQKRIEQLDEKIQESEDEEREEWRQNILDRLDHLTEEDE